MIDASNQQGKNVNPSTGVAFNQLQAGEGAIQEC